MKTTQWQFDTFFGVFNEDLSFDWLLILLMGLWDSGYLRVMLVDW